MQKCVQNKFITVMLSQGRTAFLVLNNLLIEINKINMMKTFKLMKSIDIS